MHEGRIIFAQIMDFLPREVFNACVAKYQGNNYCKNFSCRDQFLAMAFAQFTLREGLRGIQETLRANSHCLYHIPQLEPSNLRVPSLLVAWSCNHPPDPVETGHINVDVPELATRG